MTSQFQQDQEIESGDPWPRSTQQQQSQMSIGGASSIFQGWQSNPLGDTTYHATLPGASYPYLQSASRFQHSTSSPLANSCYVEADSDTHLLLPPLHSRHQADVSAFVDGHVGSRLSSVGPEPSIADAERRQDRYPDIRPDQNVPTRSVPLRKSRARQPPSETWELHKMTIEDLYLRKNLSLADTMKEMTAVHKFSATEKMYKDKFKEWKWSKNLSKDLALGMLSKAKRRLPKETIFQWGNQAWTVQRIQKTHGKSADAFNPAILENFKTPEGITWMTPQVIETTDSPIDASSTTQHHDGSRESAPRITSNPTEKPAMALDDGPYRIDLNQCSVLGLKFVVEEALNADKDGNGEEAELSLRDALSCSSRLFSPTHNNTLEIGYLLASFYVSKKRLGDANDILNWMTIKHHRILGSGHPKTIAHMLRMISLLRIWLRSWEADLLIYRVLESQEDPEHPPILLQSSTGGGTALRERFGDLLNSDDPERISACLNFLEGLAGDESNRQLLQDLIPRIINKCDDSLQTLGKLAIQSRCILAGLFVRDGQCERARDTLRGCGCSLKQQLNSQSPLGPSTLELIQRVAFTFLDSGDPGTCDKVLERVAAVACANVGIADDDLYGFDVIEFLISTASQFQEKCSWDRGRPWIEQALSLAMFIFGQSSRKTKSIEQILETQNIRGSWASMKSGANAKDFVNDTGKALVIRVYSE